MAARIQIPREAKRGDVIEVRIRRGVEQTQAPYGGDPCRFVPSQNASVHDVLKGSGFAGAPVVTGSPFRE